MNRKEFNEMYDHYLDFLLLILDYVRSLFFFKRKNTNLESNFRR